jgi:hypothetical protein
VIVQRTPLHARQPVVTIQSLITRTGQLRRGPAHAPGLRSGEAHPRQRRAVRDAFFRHAARQAALADPASTAIWSKNRRSGTAITAFLLVEYIAWLEFYFSKQI